MAHTVYRTVNLINGRYYIGVHKTDDPTDNYLGSGTVLSRSIAKNGAANFKKEIVAVFDSPAPAFELEKKLVDESRADDLCMNIRCGGSGGFDYINAAGLNGYKKAIASRDPQSGCRAIAERSAVDPEFKQQVIDRARKASAICKERGAYIPALSKRWGAKHSEETKAKIGNLLRGRTGTILGWAWMTNGKESRLSRPEEIDALMSSGWVRGKKIKVNPQRQPKKNAFHGTSSRYRTKGCRCDECVAAFRKYRREVVAARRKVLKSLSCSPQRAS